LTPRGHTRTLPAGRALAVTLNAYARVFERDVFGQLRGGGWLSAVRLSHWREQLSAALEHDLAPHAGRGYADARRRYAGHPAAWLKVAEPWHRKDAFSGLGVDLATAVRTMAIELCDATLDTAAGNARAAVAKLRQEIARGLASQDTTAELAKRVQRVFRDPARAERIARTESSRALHLGQYHAALRSGVVVAKRWMAFGDCCAECAALDGKQVDLSAPFLRRAGGRPAYRVVMFPPLHPACRCTWSEVLEDF
jgi:hypothetical protein